jgi:molybdate/tungstate transport system substrate-binding protein
VRLTLLSLTLLIACGGPRQDRTQPPITVFAAASLARPLKTLADSFQRHANVTVLSELGGSLEQSRKITELGRIPDVLLLVDDDVVAALVPTHLEWYVRFATNRLVVAFATQSRVADTITTDNWWRLLSRPDIRVGRADPGVAPVGRHTLDMLGRVDAYYSQRALADSLRARATLKYVRPNATELAALLETGEVDFIIDYESVARQYGFGFVTLPEDLAPAVLYGMSVPRQAAHGRAGIEFAAFVLSVAGQRILRDAQITVLSVPVAIGTNVPPEITALVRTSASAATTR